jgi:hypothetical protein
MSTLCLHYACTMPTLCLHYAYTMPTLCLCYFYTMSMLYLHYIYSMFILEYCHVYITKPPLRGIVALVTSIFHLLFPLNATFVWSYYGTE